VHNSARHTDTSRRLYASQPLTRAKDDRLCLFWIKQQRVLLEPRRHGTRTTNN